jgi:hypothetical protein
VLVVIDKFEIQSFKSHKSIKQDIHIELPLTVPETVLAVTDVRYCPQKTLLPATPVRSLGTRRTAGDALHAIAP